MKITFFFLNLFVAFNCLAEFTPDEIIILANTNNPGSLEIADYYARVRKVPQKNIVQVNVPDNFNVDRKIFNESIVEPLKLKIKENPYLQKSKIIVTTYGIPLKIDEIQTPENILEIQQIIKGEGERLHAKLNDEISALNKIRSHLKKDHKPIELNSQIDFSRIQQELQNIYELASQNDPDSNEVSSIKKISVNLFGSLLLSKGINKQATDELSYIKSLYTKISEELSSTKKVNSKDIKILLEKSENLKGIIGAIIETKIITDRILSKESSASIDSELSLLWSLPDGSPISSRIPNPLFIGNAREDNQQYPMFLVSRLDGSTPDVVKQNILHAVLVEKKGFNDSKFLIDSRGISFDQRDELADWDRKLVTLAKMDFGNKIDIEFDGNPQLAGKMKNISLYVGWYQLRNYEDSYTFPKGAIGYHIASEEAVNIHDVNEKGWCKNLLDRGVVATIGAVEEPYLDSFPDPLYFFPLLATGKYNLIESYYLSTKYISWRQVLFGDPLYSPFKNSSNAQKNTKLDFSEPYHLSNRIKSASTIFIRP